jgi:hypothetical protein
MGDNDVCGIGAWHNEDWDSEAGQDEDEDKEAEDRR